MTRAEAERLVDRMMAAREAMDYALARQTVVQAMVTEGAALAPESGQGEPDPKVLEITERDRWAWRLGWSAAMSIRLDRPVNPSDAPEPPATAPRPGEG